MYGMPKEWANNNNDDKNTYVQRNHSHLLLLSKLWLQEQRSIIRRQIERALNYLLFKMS